MMQKKFFFGVLAILFFYIISSFIFYYTLGLNDDQGRGLIFSGVIATVNIIIVFFTVVLNIKKDAKSFNKSFLSGLAVRFFILLAVIFSVIKFCEVDHFTFLTSLFILYLTFQILEVLILNKHLTKG